MKAKLEFNLPEEELEFRQCSKAQELSIALWDIQQEIRRLYKYKYCNNEVKAEVAEECMALFNEVLGNHSINLDELIE